MNIFWISKEKPVYFIFRLSYSIEFTFGTMKETNERERKPTLKIIDWIDFEFNAAVYIHFDVVYESCPILSSPKWAQKLYILMGICVVCFDAHCYSFNFIVSTTIKRNQNVDIRSKMGLTHRYIVVYIRQWNRRKEKKTSIEKTNDVEIPFYSYYHIDMCIHIWYFPNGPKTINLLSSIWIRMIKLIEWMRSSPHNGIVFIFPFQPFTLNLYFIEMSFCIRAFVLPFCACTYVSHTHYNIDIFNRSMVDGAQLSIEALGLWKCMFNVSQFNGWKKRRGRNGK